MQLSELARLLHTCPARFGKSPLNLSVWQHLNLILGLADRWLHTPIISQSAFSLTRTFVARLLSQWKRMQILLQGPRNHYNAIPCCIMLYKTKQCYSMLYNTIPCYTMLYHAMPCYTMLYCTLQYFVMLYYTWNVYATKLAQVFKRNSYSIQFQRFNLS